jgi:hypothetical protein
MLGAEGSVLLMPKVGNATVVTPANAYPIVDTSLRIAATATPQAATSRSHKPTFATTLTDVLVENAVFTRPLLIVYQYIDKR